MENTKRFTFDLSSAALHILAMAFMLCDHMWATIFIGHEWLTCIGRIAFPIFAFMIVEGYFHTRNLKKYMLRMLIFALVSEIPFDLMYAGVFFYPIHQNVMWTFLIALGCIWLIERAKRIDRQWLSVISMTLICVAGFLVGMVTFVDYYGVGVLTVLIFYLFRGRKWWCLVGQIAMLYWLNVEVLGGYYYNVSIFGHNFEIVQQGLAMLALIPIWLYRGRQGYHAKWFQYFCYAFYPVHALILALVAYF